MNKINKLLTIYAVFIVAAAGGAYLTLPSAGDLEIHPAHTGRREFVSDVKRRPLKEHVEADTGHPPRVRLPAYFQIAPEKESLPPVMNPDKFSGRTREAYLAAREIPETIAQLPCFCYCDESARHRSLHSCFEDGHGSRCAICIEEVLTAYRLQKEEMLKPEQIRSRLVARYAK